MQESRRLSWYKLRKPIDHGVIVRCPDAQVVDRVWLRCRCKPNAAHLPCDILCLQEILDASYVEPEAAVLEDVDWHVLVEHLEHQIVKPEGNA